MGKRSRCAAYQMRISGAEEAALLRPALQQEGGRGRNRKWQLVVPVMKCAAANSASDGGRAQTARWHLAARARRQSNQF